MSDKNLPAVQNNVPAEFLVFSNEVSISDVIEYNLGGEQLSQSDLDKIKVPAGGGQSWEDIPTIDGNVSSTEFTGIIAFSRPGRSYWVDEYSGDNNPPDCASDDGLTGFGKPGGTCASCPLNEYETSSKGKGKACKETRSLFIMLPGGMLPIVLQVPPSSLREFKKYRMRLSSFGVKLSHVITKFSLMRDKNDGGITYSKINFAKGEVLPAELREKIDAYADALKPSFERAHRAEMQSGNGKGDAPVEDNPFDSPPESEAEAEAEAVQ